MIGFLMKGTKIVSVGSGSSTPDSCYHAITVEVTGRPESHKTSALEPYLWRASGAWTRQVHFFSLTLERHGLRLYL